MHAFAERKIELKRVFLPIRDAEAVCSKGGREKRGFVQGEYVNKKAEWDMGSRFFFKKMQK